MRDTCEPRNEALERKLEHIKKDYDSAYSLMLKAGDHISSIRVWNVTVVVAYLGWMTRPDATKTVWPLLAAMLVFWIMEALVNAEAHFFQEHTLEKVDQIFNEIDLATQERLIKEHQFLGKTAASPGKQLFGKGGRIHRFCRGFTNCKTVVFYVMPLIVLILLYEEASNWLALILFLVVAISRCVVCHHRNTGM